MESIKHQELCKKVFNRIYKKAPKNASIYAQTHALPLYHSPQPINGHIPDILIYANNSTHIIIGEAKTEDDINNEHTASQFKAYLDHALSFKTFLIYYEVDIILTSHLRHFFYNSFSFRNSRFLKNIFINGVLF